LGTKVNFRAAWNEAAQIVKSYYRATLESRRRVFDAVYKPRRDILSAKWSQKYPPPPKPDGK
jgi:hypothetical protein